jgi:hypothetical protein
MDFTRGQSVNLTGRAFCEKCGTCISQGGQAAVFTGCRGPYNIFKVEIPLVCPECGIISVEAKMIRN